MAIDKKNYVYQEKKSFVETLHEQYGWPLKIQARGEIACLCDIQPLLEGKAAPIYRFPGGRSLVDEIEIIPVK